METTNETDPAETPADPGQNVGIFLMAFVVLMLAAFLLADLLAAAFR